MRTRVYRSLGERPVLRVPDSPAGLWRLCWTPGRTLTCGYGFRRTYRTPSIDLRITRLGGFQVSQSCSAHVTVTAVASPTATP
jgi:hypothetical protein